MANEIVRGVHGERVPAPRDKIHFEHSDINPRGTFLVGAGVLVGLWICTALLYFYFVFLGHYRQEMSRPALPIEARANPLPPEPRLQQSPPKDYQAFLKNEEGALDHYSWIDKAHGTVAIPIGRAMELLAQRGIPPQKAPANLELSLPQAGTRATGFEGKVEPEPR